MLVALAGLVVGRKYVLRLLTRLTGTWVGSQN